MIQMLADTFRRNVRHLLESRGLTRTELAETMNVSRQYVTIYLNGHSDPGLTVVERFAEALDVKPESLLRPKIESEKIAR